MGESLLEQCHRAVLWASWGHVSPWGFELLVHPRLRGVVEEYERENRLRAGSFGTLAGARRPVVFTLGAGGDFAVFCLSHIHRLVYVPGVANSGETGGSGTIAT